MKSRIVAFFLLSLPNAHAVLENPHDKFDAVIAEIRSWACAPELQKDPKEVKETPEILSPPPAPAPVAPRAVLENEPRLPNQALSRLDFDFVLYQSGGVIQIAREVQQAVQRLRPGGVISIKDFAIPQGPLRVFINNNGERVETDFRSAMEMEYLSSYKGQRFYLNRSQWEALLQSLGLRILVSRNIEVPFPRTPAEIFADTGHPLEIPSAGIYIQAQKITNKQPAAYARVASGPTAKPASLSLRVFRNRESGLRLDLLSGAQPPTEIIPYFVEDERVYVILRTDHPLLLSSAGQAWSGGAAFLPNPLTLDPPLGRRALRTEMGSRYGVKVKNVELSAPFYPSPLQTMSRKQPIFIKLAERPAAAGHGAQILELRELVNNMRSRISDGSLEVALYRLSRAANEKGWERANLPAEPVVLPKTAVPPLQFGREKPWREWKPWFAHLNSEDWKIERGEFTESSADGLEVSRRSIEYGVPAHLSPSIMTILPVANVGGKVYVGLALVDSPTPQQFKDSPHVWSLPTLRLSRAFVSREHAELYARDWFTRRFGIKVVDFVPLGGEYLPDPQISADTVHPYAASVERTSPLPELEWFPLDRLQEGHMKLNDGLLLMSLYRALYQASP